MIVVEDPKDNIWTENPHLELVTEFKDFKDKEGTRKSSKILTAIYLIWDPKSNLRNAGMSDLEILEDVTNNYLSYKDFNWDDYGYIKDIYFEKCISKTEKLFLRIESDLDDFNNILEKYKFSKDNAADRAKLTKEYKALLLEYMDVKTRVQEEKKNMNQNRDNYTDSLIESFGQG